jgi:hypothetical protein
MNISPITRTRRALSRLPPAHGLGAAASRAELVFLSAFTLMVFMIPAFGTIGAAWSLIAGTTFATIANYVQVTRLLELPVRELARAIWRPLTGAAVLAAVILLAAESLQLHAPRLPDFAKLVSLSLTGAFAFIAAVYGLWWLQKRPSGPEVALLIFIAERARRGRATA